ncbi:MAG: amidohydrolase family protein [Deltaproteobacteria bacterium]|nr:amidohydrolase family protein [Deltaproteobacteria bacterium]
MARKIIYGKYLVVDPEKVIPSGALLVENDKVADVGTFAEITKRHTADEMIGSSEHLVTPGFVNAHGHGKGITDFQRGAIDNTLETWKFRTYPEIDRYYDTLWTAIKLIESGVTTTMHNHDLVNADEYYDEFSTTIRAYLESGLRLAFAPTLITQNVFVYGDNEAFLTSLPRPTRQLCGRILRRIGRFDLREYLKAVTDLRNAYDSQRVRIMHGPLSPQWVADEALVEVKNHAAAHAMRIHIHTLQTQLQKLYGLNRYGKSLLEHLHDLAFLGENVTCGHCVWLSERDIALLSETGTSVTHHPSCNLRVRNGIAPVFALLRKGVVVGIGMDDKELGDDKDFIEEMRVASKLHRLASHRLDSEHLLPVDCFRMGTRYGASVLGFSDITGTLEKGKQADIVLLDLKRMSEPFVYPDHSPIDLLIYRGRAADVDTVLVGGEIILKNRRLTRLDREEVIRKLRESLPKRYAEEFRENNKPFADLKRAVAGYFDPWYEDMERIEKAPYYLMNNRY